MCYYIRVESKGDKSMWVKDEVTNGYELEKMLWGQAVDTWKTIANAGKEDEALRYFEDIYCDEEAIDITTINDILAYDEADLMEYLGLNDLKEEFITINETDCNCLMVDEDIVEYLRKEVEESNSGVVTTDLYSIEDEIGRDLTEEECEELIRVGG